MSNFVNVNIRHPKQREGGGTIGSIDPTEKAKSVRIRECKKFVMSGLKSSFSNQLGPHLSKHMYSKNHY